MSDWDISISYQLGHDGYRPAQTVQCGGELPHGDQGLTAHCPPFRVNLQDVHQVDLDGIHPVLVVHVLRRDGLPARPRSTHSLSLALGLIFSHLKTDICTFHPL